MSDVAYIGPGGRQPRSRRLLRTVVGDALRRRRLDQGRTLADVARAARVSMPYLSEVERGRKEASSEVLAAVCDALRLDLSDLLVDVGREMVQDRSPVIRLDPARRHQQPGMSSGRPTTSGGQPTASAHRFGDVVLLAA